MDQVREAVHAVAEDAPEQARKAAAAVSRRWFVRAVAGAAFVALLVSVSTVAGMVSLYVRQASTDAAVSQLRQLAEQAHTQGEQANAQLSQRGEATVPIPTPGSASDSDVLVASATARVLASLPAAPRPSAAALGQAVAEYLAANPPSAIGPTPQQLSEARAGYLATNPVPSGPAGPTGDPGPTGPPGPPPTQGEIEAAFADYINGHPDALCPRGGTFAQLRITLADGGSADTWTCVIAQYDPSASQPPPTTAATTATTTAPDTTATDTADTAATSTTTPTTPRPGRRTRPFVVVTIAPAR
jgi:hypothetical protein